jgi:hypothetical protein
MKRIEKKYQKRNSAICELNSRPNATDSTVKTNSCKLGGSRYPAICDLNSRKK